MTQPRTKGRPPLRKLSLLHTLWQFNVANIFPYATKLIKEDDGRGHVPDETISARRILIRDMRDAGYIQRHRNPNSPFDLLEITKAGIDYLARFGAMK